MHCSPVQLPVQVNHLFSYHILAQESLPYHEDGVEYWGISNAPVLDWDVLGKTARCMGEVTRKLPGLRNL